MSRITDISQLDLNKFYTVADYFSWHIKERIELIQGKIFKMSPAPKARHQYISGILFASLFNSLKKSRCKVFSAPFDVMLPVRNKKGEQNTIVQPDICVICDISKIDENGCNGAPDLIIEIISQSSVSKDLHEKYDLYEKTGVKEYWIVHPNDKTINVFILSKQGKYVPSKPLTYGDNITSIILPEFELDLNELFEDFLQESSAEYNVKRI